jgi:hypothetical protein
VNQSNHPENPEGEGRTVSESTGATPEEQPGGHAAAVSHASMQEDAAARAEGLGEDATGDIVIDAALEDLSDVPADDLDGQIEAGRRVHDTLQGRLSDLGGE